MPLCVESVTRLLGTQDFEDLVDKVPAFSDDVLSTRLSDTQHFDEVKDFTLIELDRAEDVCTTKLSATYPVLFPCDDLLDVTDGV